MVSKEKKKEVPYLKGIRVGGIEITTKAGKPEIVEEMAGIVEEEDSGEEIRSSHLGQGMETGVSYLKTEDGKEERRL